MSFPLISPTPQFFDNNGDPLVGGTIEFRSPTTNALINSYPTADDADAQTNANDNPLTLNARGEAANGLYLEDGVSYKIILKDSAGATIWNQDDVKTPTGTQATIGALLYPRTAAEISAGVTPTDYSKEPGNVLRYGTNTTPGTTDMTAAIQAALTVGDSVVIPKQAFLYTSGMTISSAKTVTVDGTLKYGGSYNSSNPHISITADNVHIRGGEFDGNQDIGSIIQFGATTTGGSVRGATFRNLLSKTELGAASGDMGCVVLKGTEAAVSDCEFYDCLNTDSVTTNDSFPRAIVITGNDNLVSDVFMKDVRCPIVTTGSRNKLANVRQDGVLDNGAYIGGQHNIFEGLYIKAVTDEPVVFTGDYNAVVNLVIDNTEADTGMNAIGVQNADYCVIDGITVIGTLKAANFIKARSGNTQSSLKVYSARATLKTSSQTFEFSTGNTDFELINSNIHLIKDTGYDHNSVFVGGASILTNCHFHISEEPAFSTANTYHYFYQVDNSLSTGNTIHFEAGGYARAINGIFEQSIGWHNIAWNNTWGAGYVSSATEARKEVFSTAAPTSGTWRVGDVAWHSAPAASGTMGWVCTTAGTPGTWKTFGAISA